MIKRILAVLLFVMIGFSNAYAAPFDRMVFFGDSLSDTGNAYKLFLKLLPKSPPYYHGRFSNGPTWAELVGKHYLETNFVPYRVYAVGGATAAYHEPDGRSFAPSVLSSEIEKYLLSTSAKDRNNAVAVIWIGGNDYFYNENISDDEATRRVVGAINKGIKTLKEHGVHKFLVLNLPDLSRIPQTRNEGISERMHRLILLHNVKIADMVTDFQKTYPDSHIVLIDAYSIFNEVLDHTAEFNQRNNTHFTNTYDACWTGGYFRVPKNSADPKTATFTQAAIQSQSPDIKVAAQTSTLAAAGILPCTDPDNHIFWDNMHPTEAIHHAMAEIVLTELLTRTKYWQ